MRYSLKSFPEYQLVPVRDRQKIFWRALGYTLSRPPSAILICSVNAVIIGVLIWMALSFRLGPIIFCAVLPFVMVLLALFQGAVIAHTAGPVLEKLIHDFADGRK